MEGKIMTCNAYKLLALALVASLALTGVVSAGEFGTLLPSEMNKASGRVHFLYTPEEEQKIACISDPILVYEVGNPYGAFPVDILPDRQAFYTVWIGDYVIRHGNAAPVYFSVGRYHTEFVDVGVCVP